MFAVKATRGMAVLLLLRGLLDGRKEYASDRRSLAAAT
jgi:hypothetical protein